MTFAQPVFLVLLLGVALLGLLEWRRSRRPPSAIRFPDVGVAAAVPATVWVRLRLLPPVLRLSALTLGVLAIARPQVHDVLLERSAEGVDVMLALDVSSSMLARDFAPNRLEAAQALARRFVEGRVSDRIGLVVFAGRAFTSAPPSLDYEFVGRMISEARPGMTEDGTAIGSAIATAVASLRESDASSRVIVLLTDGRNNRGEIDPFTAAELAQLFDIRIYAVGIGAASDEPAADPALRTQSGAEPDEGVDSRSLEAIASRTGGTYFHAGDRYALEAIAHEMALLERSEVAEERFVVAADRFRLFLWPAFLLLLLEACLVSTRLRTIP